MPRYKYTDYKDLPEEGIEILKEHALNFYLPFDGGVFSNFKRWILLFKPSISLLMLMKT